jgi:elongation factor 2 kinase
MALFFKTFRHNSLADSLGVPVFALSKNELKVQAKYEDDQLSWSNENSSFREVVKGLDNFERLDVNRKFRQSLLMIPPLQVLLNDEQKDTERRSNQSFINRKSMSKSLRLSFSQRPIKPVFSRTTSDVDEVRTCLELAKQDFTFDHKVFHRKSSGELLHKHKHPMRSSLMIRQVSAPIEISNKTKENLGKVHYQLAVLHGMGRFPEVVQSQPYDTRDSLPPHDAFSVLFHLAHAASLKCVPACLALARLHAGLDTSVSNLLGTVVPVDFDMAKILLRRAMEPPLPPALPKAAAGCLLYQIYLDERQNNDLEGERPSDTTIMQLLLDILELFDEAEKENRELENHKKRSATPREERFHPGDRVEGNYFLEGNYYPGVIESVSEDGQAIVIVYDDDGSTETLSPENVRLVVPPTATQTALGGPLSDDEALESENSDEKFLVEIYELRAELAELKAKAGDRKEAAALYEEASNEAMAAQKMKMASEWSNKSAELLG